jgi:transposase
VLGVDMNALSKMFGVHTSSVLKWIRRYAATHDGSGQASRNGLG